MIALDTNVPVRLVTRNDETQALRAKAHHVGCSHTLTFDRRMAALPGVQLL